VTVAPLDGFVVGITADRRWSEQAELLRRRGAEVMHGPSIETAYLASDDVLRAATVALIDRPPAYLAATTGIGIRAWLEAAQCWGLGDALLDALRGTRIVARGPKAAGTVQSAGLPVWRSAANEQMDQLLAHLLAEPLDGVRVAVQLYGMPAPDVTDALAAAGAEVLEVPVYQWRSPDDAGPAVRLAQAAIDGRLHAVTFTAAPAVTNLFALATGAGLDEALRDAFNRRGVVAACVGPVCARGALESGIVAPLVPEIGRLGLLVRALSERLVRDRRTVPMAGVDVILQGLVALVGEDRVRLNCRERALLDTLAARPGTVFSLPALVREVWSATGADPHAVEVAIARLRPRLGAAGAALVAVPGRGYRLEP
jgi:uroporphyrinogen-III synthase